MFWGALLVIIGVLILLNRTHVIDLEFSEYFIPVILIAWGVRMLFRSSKSKT